MLLLDYPQHKFYETHQLQDTKRGSKGFGSTGTNMVTKVLNTKQEDEKVEKDFKYDINPRLLPKEQGQLYQLLDKYHNKVMAVSFNEFEGKHSLYYHHINTEDAKPIYE